MPTPGDRYHHRVQRPGEAEKALKRGRRKGAKRVQQVVKAAVEGGPKLPATLREQIAIAVAEANGCGYCLAAHSTVGKMVGLTNADVLASRRGTVTDLKAAAALEFARVAVAARGDVTDADLKRVREAGYGDAEVAEIVANVALNVFTNYFNLVAGTEIDF